MVLVDWYLVIRLPENLLIEAIRTSNTLLTWLCLYSYRSTCRDIDISKDMDILKHLITFMFRLVTNIHFYLFTCYFW